MKKVITLIMLMAILVCACEKAPKKNTEVSVREDTSEMVKPVIPELMKGELDEFHPNSEFESIRKKKLTNLGTLKTPPPAYTIDFDTAIKALNHQDLTPYNIERITSKLPWRPKYPFDYENDLSALKRLYDSHNLGTSVDKTDPSEIGAIKALMVYTHNFMEGGVMPTPETEPGPSAEVITKLRREKGIGGTSKHYSALFCQLALAYGFNARIIGMHTFDDEGKLITNNICEIFVNYWDKWVAYDVYNRGTFYERNKIPQSALEIHNIAMNRNYNALNTFSQFGDFSDIISVREKLLPAYKHIYMYRMNDILRKSPRGGTIPWQALYQTHLVWEDIKSPVSEGRFDELEQFYNTANPDYPLDGVKYVTHEYNQFYWRLNAVDIHIERVDDNAIMLHLDTITPNFKEFVINKSDGDTRQSSNTFYFKNFVGNNSVRIINDFGKGGRYTHLDISP
ncbi:hypothetical protein ACFL6P_05380 [Candidatus Latescibacterota bacterium]